MVPGVNRNLRVEVARGQHVRWLLLGERHAGQPAHDRRCGPLRARQLGAERPKNRRARWALRCGGGATFAREWESARRRAQRDDSGAEREAQRRSLRAEAPAVTNTASYHRQQHGDSTAAARACGAPSRARTSRTNLSPTSRHLSAASIAAYGGTCRCAGGMTAVLAVAMGAVLLAAAAAAAVAATAARRRRNRDLPN